MGNLVNLPNITPDVIENLRYEPEVFEKKKSTFSEKNYLNVRLDENETSREVRIRLLPMDLETGNAFAHAHFHTLRVPKEISKSGWRSFICLKKTDEVDHEKFGNRCPFCELNQLAFQKMSEETDPIKKDYYKTMSLDNLAKDVIIVRCIERDKEDEGVKFWKFNLSRRKDDPYNVMMDLYRSAKKEGEKMGENVNIFDLYEGRDIIINIKKSNNEKDVKTVLSLSLSGYKSPITKDEEQLKKWIYDEKKWTDVYTPKPYDYMNLIAQSHIPYFDKEEGRWVSKEEYEKKKNMVTENANNAVAQAEQAAINLAMQGVPPQACGPQTYSQPAMNPQYQPVQQPQMQQFQQQVPQQGAYQGSYGNYGVQPAGQDLMSQLNADEELPY